MKPEFALSLSFDGIRLLHRAAGGWREVGMVDVDSPTLGEDLKALRRKAGKVKIKRVRSKLLIPDAQIKYLTIDTGEVDDDARRAAALEALDGATPYPVDALAFDISAEGPKTHVAAVARETLAEAEAFAVEHNFRPVSFVAAPEDAGFLGEPFFGQTVHADKYLRNGGRVKPDGIRVVVISHPDPSDGPEEATENTDAPATFEETDDVEAHPAAPADAAPQTDAEDAGVQSTDEQPEASGDNTAPETVDAAKATAAKGAPEDTEATPETVQTPGDSDEPTEPAPDASVQTDKNLNAQAKPESGDAATGDDANPDAVQTDDAEDKTAASEEAAENDKDTEKDKGPSGLIGFATRRTASGVDGASATPLGGVTRDPPKSRPATARLTVSEDTKDTAPPPPALSPQQIAAKSLRTAPPIDEVPAEQTAGSKKASARKGGFLSRRKPKRVPPAPPAAVADRAARTTATPASGPSDAEAQRMTVFGARAEAEVGGKPRFLGLILTAILLVFLAGVAAWASVFLDDGLAKFFPKRERTLASTLPADATQALAEDVGATVDLEPTEQSDDALIIASLNEDIGDELTPEDAAVLDALRNPQPDPSEQPELDQAALEARYAVTGIWPQAPQVPQEPSGLIQLEDLYVTGIDPVSPALDAIALPGTDSYLTDVALPEVASPPEAGTRFAFDSNGRIVPTEEGALSPDGFTVFLGRPPLLPPETRRAAEEEPVTPEVAQPDTRQLAAQRPRPRPSDLVEQNERATLGGLSRSELAELRPRLRPTAPQEVAAPPETDAAAVAAAVAEAAEPISPLAAAQSYRPQTRPRNFDRTVARASRAAAAAAPQRVAAVAPRAVTVTPSIPSATSVAREATVRNAINLSRVNLIGVYGTPSNRRALVRLRNGRYQKVAVGDRFDGGRVSAIGDSELRYQKGNRNVVLKMPN
ncbi:MSCRAMM family adhesin SdrC [Tateyamaria omphalii]|uniref:MSCRAMM family adhesin SdrC n=1 Tax=Tateyamaria omphalii TaxID=299262 RepID=UPI001C9963A0|nr:MSCRAMM family adhesin SdrC [Tateyamaria omphalii]MBY5932078.1 MSCRAMM family adhesin SdrC [Tateyamaria omphalii]